MPHPAVDVAEEIDDLTECLDAFRATVEDLGPRLFEKAGSVSDWTCAQHLYHVALATDLALRNVTALVSGRGMSIVSEGEPNDLALRVLGEGRYPRGESRSPRLVQPGDEVDPGFLAEEMRLNREGLAQVRELGSKIPAAQGRIRHPDLGHLDAPQWLRFARLHARHHLLIVRDLEAALGD